MVAVSFHFHFDQIHIDYDIPLSMPVYIFIPRYSFKIHMSSESHHNTFSHECHQSCERNTFPRFIILLGSNIFLSFFITSIHVFPPSILLEKHLSWIHNSLGIKVSWVFSLLRFLYFRHQSCETNTFPGFIIPLGSNIFLSCFMIWIPVSPISFWSRRRLPIPIPCSPVHVPSNSMAILSTITKYCITSD